MASSNPLSTIFQYLDNNADKLIERLREAISILPDSSSEKSLDSAELIEWTNEKLRSFGFTTTLKSIEHNDEEEEEESPQLLPVIFAKLETGRCPNRYTLLVYSHLDGGSAKTKDGWNIEADQSWEDICVKGGLNMSSVMAWLSTFEAFRSAEIDIPVNVKLIVACKDIESNQAFRNLLVSEKEGFLGDVEYICINEGFWLQSDTPSLVRKLRGFCRFSFKVECSTDDLDTIKCSGIVKEASNDLLYLMDCLMDENGNLRFSELNLEEEEMPEEERVLYETTDLDLGKFMESIGAYTLSHKDDKAEIMKYRCMVPSITIEEVQISSKKKNEWSIPSFATAEFSIFCFHRSMSEVFEIVNAFLQERWALRKSSNKFTVSLENTLESWFADLDHIHYQTAAKAILRVYQKPLLYLNSSSTIPVVNLLQDVTNKNILLLPISSENGYMTETVSTKNYLDICKVFASYLYEMGEIPKISSQSSASFVSCEAEPEVCVCGRVEEEVPTGSERVEEEVPAGSGDAEVVPSPKPRSISEEDDSKCVCPYRLPLQTKDQAVVADDVVEDTDLPPPPPQKPCKCVLQYQPVDVEIISLKSTPSKGLTTEIQDENIPKREVTPSVDTIRCSCVPERYRTLKRRPETSLSPEKEEELMKSMRSVGSRISGLSACELPSGPHEKTPKMNILGCVCPEKSQESVFGRDMEKNRMFCPVKKGKDEICNKGGKRRHHIAGPPPLEGYGSEESLGPLSHCSCRSEESIVAPPNCDCPTDGPSHIQVDTNFDDEVY